MLWDEIKPFLTPDERTAVDLLESFGWIVMTETRIEDCKKKDGTRRRTFSASGRYAVCLGLKTVDGREKSAGNFFTPVQTPAVSSKVEEQLQPDEELQIVIGDNFWMDRNAWSRLHSDSFQQLVTIDELESLKAAPVDVQDEVKQKFERICDPALWPL